MKKIIGHLKEDWEQMPTRIKVLAFLGGIDVTVSIFTPIILATLWVTVSNTNGFGEYLFYGIGLLATLFRAIKVGWMK